MRYRPLDANGDYTVGVPFLYNSPQCVGQAISTRLKLWMEEWFLDNTAGTPWRQSILGKSTNPNAYIKQQILSTQGVTAIITFSTSFVAATRTLTVSGAAATLYGQASFSASIQAPTQ
jgi:hypothetical protein